MRRFDRIGLNNEMEEIQFASIFTVYRLTYTYTKKSALSIVEKTWQTGRSKNSSVNLNNMFTFKVSRRQSTVVISLWGSNTSAHPSSPNCETITGRTIASRTQDVRPFVLILSVYLNSHFWLPWFRWRWNYTVNHFLPSIRYFSRTLGSGNDIVSFQWLSQTKQSFPKQNSAS